MSQIEPWNMSPLSLLTVFVFVFSGKSCLRDERTKEQRRFANKTTKRIIEVEHESTKKNPSAAAVLFCLNFLARDSVHCKTAKGQTGRSVDTCRRRFEIFCSHTRLIVSRHSWNARRPIFLLSCRRLAINFQGCGVDIVLASFSPPF